MKTITYSELIKLIEQGKPPKKIKVIGTVSEDYKWHDSTGDYYDYKDRPIEFIYSLKELVRTSAIQIIPATNAEKFKEVFGIELCRWADGKPAACPPHKRECETSTTNIGSGNCEKCAEWWDEPYEGDK